MPTQLKRASKSTLCCPARWSAFSTILFTIHQWRRSQIRREIGGTRYPCLFMHDKVELSCFTGIMCQVVYQRKYIITFPTSISLRILMWGLSKMKAMTLQLDVLQSGYLSPCWKHLLLATSACMKEDTWIHTCVFWILPPEYLMKTHLITKRTSNFTSMACDFSPKNTQGNLFKTILLLLIKHLTFC